MNYNIRKIKPNEYELLDDFLYEAIFIPEGVQAPPKSIICNFTVQRVSGTWHRHGAYENNA